MEYDLIIFDCDGTIVDTENLSNGLIALMLNEVGIKVTVEETVERFRGKGFSNITAFINDNIDHDLEFNFEESFRQKCKILFEAELKAIDCVEHFINNLSVPCCVASNGPQIKMKTTLEVTGLNKYLPEPHVFSAYDINKFKPAPDLFLYACDMMGANPSKTLVIEDTIVGGQAARNAGMDVLIYAPENQTEYLDAGYKVFSTYCNFDYKSI